MYMVLEVSRMVFLYLKYDFRLSVEWRLFPKPESDIYNLKENLTTEC